MSAAHTTPAPARPDRRLAARWDRRRHPRRHRCSTVLTIAVWPASEADKARADGEQFGQAVAQLQAAQSTAEVDAALAEVQAAASDTRDHAGDAVAEQVDDQADALDRAADGFVGVHAADDEFEAGPLPGRARYRRRRPHRQAEDFRTTGPEVQQAFWDGYDTGLAGD